MLAITRSADVTPEANLRNPLHISGEAHNQVIHHGLETQGRHRQKFKSGVSVAPIDKYTGKLDHSPLVVVEAELGQVWPFCCWYSTTMLIHRK